MQNVSFSSVSSLEKSLLGVSAEKFYDSLYDTGKFIVNGTEYTIRKCGSDFTVQRNSSILANIKNIFFKKNFDEQDEKIRTLISESGSKYNYPALDYEEFVPLISMNPQETVVTKNNYQESLFLKLLNGRTKTIDIDKSQKEAFEALSHFSNESYNYTVDSNIENKTISLFYNGKMAVSIHYGNADRTVKIYASNIMSSREKFSENEDASSRFSKKQEAAQGQLQWERIMMVPLSELVTEFNKSVNYNYPVLENE